MSECVRRDEYSERPCGIIMSRKAWLPRIFDQFTHARRNVEKPTTNAIVLPSARLQGVSYARFKKRARTMQ